MQKLFNTSLFVFLFVFVNVATGQNVRSYSIETNFYSSGLMGDIRNIQLVKNNTDSFVSGPDCIRVTYTAGKEGWGGVYWQYPANNWCSNANHGRDLRDSSYNRITFWVKGARGGENVRFKAGYNECGSFSTEEQIVTLTTQWTPITISLAGRDLSNVMGAFCFVVDSHENNPPVTFYLDSIQFEGD